MNSPNVLEKLRGQTAARLGRVKPEFSAEPIFSCMSNIVLAAESLTTRMLNELDRLCSVNPDVRLVLLNYEAGPWDSKLTKHRNLHQYCVFKRWNNAKMHLEDVWPKW